MSDWTQRWDSIKREMITKNISCQINVEIFS
jgi:hypothetical protein